MKIVKLRTRREIEINDEMSLLYEHVSDCRCWMSVLTCLNCKRWDKLRKELEKLQERS